MFSIKGRQPDPIAQLVPQPRRWLSRLQLVLILTGLMAIAPARAEQAFIIVDAMRLPPTARQPTWIALMRKGRLVHIATGQTIVGLDPGHYSLHHIDFGKSEYSGIGTVAIVGMRNYYVEASLDSIGYMGMIQIGSHTGQFNFGDKIKLVPENALLERACHSSPEVLARLPVRIRIGRRQARLLKVRCKEDRG